MSGKTTLRACAVSVMPGKPHNNKIPTCSSLRLVSRSFTSVYVATLRLTTTDVGLMPGLNVAWWLSGRALDLRFTGHGSIPSQSAFTLHNYVNAALHLSGIAKSSTVPASAEGKGRILTCLVAGNTV